MRRFYLRRRVRLSVLAAAAAVVGVFLTWTAADGISLDGLQGPNNGLLVVIVALFALGWSRSLARGSLVGAIGTAGAGVVIASTAVENWLDNRDVLGARLGLGTVVVAAAGAALVAAAVAAVARRAAWTGGAPQVVAAVRQPRSRRD